jgi:hypothetical protein
LQNIFNNNNIYLLAPTLLAATSSSSMVDKRWTPFADIVSSDQSKSSVLTTSASTNSFPTSISQPTSSSVALNTKGIKNESIKSVASFSSLTDAVKNAMYRGHINAGSNQIRHPSSGATLSTKDLNHLSPQSM